MAVRQIGRDGMPTGRQWADGVKWDKFAWMAKILDADGRVIAEGPFFADDCSLELVPSVGDLVTKGQQ